MSIEGPAGTHGWLVAAAACTELIDGSLTLGDIEPGRLARDSAIAKMISSFSEEMFLIVFR